MASEFFCTKRTSDAAMVAWPLLKSGEWTSAVVWPAGSAIPRHWASRRSVCASAGEAWCGLDVQPDGKSAGFRLIFAVAVVSADGLAFVEPPPPPQAPSASVATARPAAVAVHTVTPRLRPLLGRPTRARDHP